VGPDQRERRRVDHAQAQPEERQVHADRDVDADWRRRQSVRREQRLVELQPPGEVAPLAWAAPGLRRRPDPPGGLRPPGDTRAVFILYGLVAGLIAGFLLGGRLEHLAAVRFRLGALALIALAVQLALFSPLADGLSDDVARLIYVGSTALVGVVVLAN